MKERGGIEKDNINMHIQEGMHTDTHKHTRKHKRMNTHTNTRIRTCTPAPSLSLKHTHADASRETQRASQDRQKVHVIVSFKACLLAAYIQ